MTKFFYQNEDRTGVHVSATPFGGMRGCRTRFRIGWSEIPLIVPPESDARTVRFKAAAKEGLAGVLYVWGAEGRDNAIKAIMERP